jgi:hypothetical protein
MMAKEQTWNKHLQRIAKQNDTGNHNLTIFADTSNPTKLKTTEERIKALAEENEVIILLTNQLNGITLVHSPTILGGTRSRPENKIVALQGLSNDAGAILIDHISATKAIQVTILKGEDILKYTTVTDLENLTATGSRIITNFDCTPCLFPALYETEIILKTGTNNRLELILALVHRAKAFDETKKR